MAEALSLRAQLNQATQRLSTLEAQLAQLRQGGVTAMVDEPALLRDLHLRQRDQWGQCQALLVARVVVVYAVHQVLHAHLARTACRAHVVELAVGDVFDEGEEQHAGTIQGEGGDHAEFQLMDGDVTRGDAQTEEQGQRYGDMRFGECFQYGVLEDASA